MKPDFLLKCTGFYLQLPEKLLPLDRISLAAVFFCLANVKSGLEVPARPRLCHGVVQCQVGELNTQHRPRHVSFLVKCPRFLSQVTVVEVFLGAQPHVYFLVGLHRIRRQRPVFNYVVGSRFQETTEHVNIDAAVVFRRVLQFQPVEEIGLTNVHWRNRVIVNLVTDSPKCRSSMSYGLVPVRSDQNQGYHGRYTTALREVSGLASKSKRYLMTIDVIVGHETAKRLHF